MWKVVILCSIFLLSGFECGNIYRQSSNGWNQDSYDPNNYYQQYGAVVNDWNSYQQGLHNQGYYWPAQQTYQSYNHEQQPTPTTQHHKGNCKHKTTHVEHIKKKDEIVTTTTTAATVATTKKPPIIEIDINWPSLKKKPSHVTDKLHSHEAALTNVLNDTIDKVADQVDKAFTAIKQLVDVSVDDKTGHVHQPLGHESLSLVDKFTKKIKAIERHFQKLKGGSLKKLDFDSDEDDDIVKIDSDEESTAESNIVTGAEVVTNNNNDDKKGRSMKFDKTELQYDIKSSISDALKKTQDSFSKLVDEQFDKINKKIADVGSKWDVALDKFYSTMEKLKFSTTPKPALIDETEYKPTATTPSPLPSAYGSTTPDYFKYTIPTEKFRAEEAQQPLTDDADSLSNEVRRLIDVRISDDDDRAKPDDSAMMLDELIDTEIEQEENDKSEIVDESGKSVDDLQSEVVDDVKDRLKMMGVAEADVDVEKEVATITSSLVGSDTEADDGSGDEDEEDNVEESNQLSSAGGDFDELEVIQLIPVIIEQLRQGHVTEMEQETLSKIFGDLWPVMVTEAERSKDNEMNPLLRTILDSEEVRHTKRDIAKQIGNDIYKNSVRRVYRGDNSDDSVKAQRPYIAMDDERRLLSPSERLLRMVAAIVHKANAMERTARKIKQQRKKMIRKQQRKTNANPLGILTVEGQPKRRFVDKIFGMNRIKRSLIRLSTDLTDMRTFVDQINHSESDYSDENEQETDEQFVNVNSSGQDQDENEIDDYLNDDYYYDDEEEEDDDIDADSQSLHFQPRSNNIFDDYESGSVREFIELARQRDRRQHHGESEEVDDDDDDYSLDSMEFEA